MTIVLIAVLVNNSNQVEYATLFTGLTEEEAGTVMEALQEQGVEVVAAPDGTLMVPRDQVQELRYSLTASGIPGTDALDYSLYSENASSFGATDQDKAFYEQAQLQFNISQTINRMDKVKTSTVLLAIAEQSPYVLSGQEPEVSSASILITLRDPNVPLTQAEVNSIRDITSKAVPSLAADEIAIVDQNMRSYGTQEEENVSNAVQMQFELQQHVAQTLQEQIITLLTPVFGPDNISANVNVVLDFDSTTTNSLTLSPPTNDAENMGIITSMRQTAERLQGVDEVAEGEPGMDPNGGTLTYQVIDDLAGTSTYYNAVTEVNAEVNEVSQQIEEAQGDIVEISATVILNGGDALTDILPEVRSQVATAIGVPLNSITVSAMPFEANALYEQQMLEAEEAQRQAETRAFIQSLIIPLLIVGGVVAAALILVSYMRKKRKEEQQEEQWRLWEQQQAEERARIEQEAPGQLVDIMADEEIDPSELLKDKNEALQNVRKLVDEDSAAIAQLLRNWLSDNANYGG